MPKTGSGLDGFAALYDGTGNSDVTIGETVTTKCVLPYDLVQRVQDAGVRPLDGKPIGSISALWPMSMLREKLLQHVAVFVSQIQKHHYEPLDRDGQFLVWGPYTEKVGPLAEYTPEAGNDFIPDYAKRKAERVWTYQGDEIDWSKGCAFLIRGRFTRHARYGTVDEQTGVLVV